MLDKHITSHKTPSNHAHVKTRNQTVCDSLNPFFQVPQSTVAEALLITTGENGFGCAAHANDGLPSRHHQQQHTAFSSYFRFHELLPFSCIFLYAQEFSAVLCIVVNLS
jgi:hypothetical protein